MFSNRKRIQNFPHRLFETTFLVIAAACLIYLSHNCDYFVFGYPTTSSSLLSHNNKFEDKIVSASDNGAEQSFQQFINSKPDSILIGELKPNASELDMMILKNKIASAILSIQAMEKTPRAHDLEPSNGDDCYIEVTRVERVAGKCHKVNNGLPICQSEHYIAMNSGCS